MTDERDQRQRRPQPGDGPELRPRPYQAAVPSRPAGMPSEPDGTGVWTPSWDDDDDGPHYRAPKVEDPIAKHYYVPPSSGPRRAPGQPPRQPQPYQNQPNRDQPNRDQPYGGQPRHGRHHDPDATDVIPRVRGALPREPELITHREPLPHQPQQYARPPAGPGVDRQLDDEDVPLTADQQAALKRAKRWRRVRRIGYVAVFALFLGPILVFLIGYAAVDVPSFAAVANRQQQAVTIFYSDGTTQLATFPPPDGNRINVKYSDVPEHVRNAVLAAEDRSFYSNPGFDAKGIARAAWKQLNGEAGGGSGITQQYVKVATNQDEFSLKRKFKEVVIATKISRNTPKEEILENYLNIIYFGRQATGIQAASRAYFDKDVKDLTVSEGALLAGMIQSPSKSDPVKNPERATNRWNFVLDGMVEQGWLPAADRASVQFPEVLDASALTAGVANDFSLHIRNQVEEELAEQGIDRAALNRFGGKIITTIDRPAQDKALEAISKQLDGKPENLHASLVAVDPKTGAVRAYFGGNEGVGIDLASPDKLFQQPGSSFKPFVMLAALEQDIGLGSVYPGKGPLTFGSYKVDNSESADYPELPLKKAMTYSVNTAFVKLTEDVGPTKVADAAHQAGIPRTVDDRQTLVDSGGGSPGLSIGLGSYEVRTIDMAAAFASFAAQGTRRAPYFVQEYIGADDESRYQHIEKAEPAFDLENGDRNGQLACNVTESMVDVAAYSKFPLAGGRQSAAKTGTAQRGSTGENSNTWTVGFTPSISAAVWVGDPAQTALKLGNRNVFGATVAGPIWKAFMDAYLAESPKETFPKCKPIGKEDKPPPPPPPTAPPPTTQPTTPPPTTILPSITITRPTRPTRPTPSTGPPPTCGGLFQPPCPTTEPSGPGPGPGPGG